MIYIKTEPLNAYIFPQQKETLKRIQSEIFEKYKVKIPISELVRQALEHGIPAVDKDQMFFMNLGKLKVDKNGIVQP